MSDGAWPPDETARLIERGDVHDRLCPMGMDSADITSYCHCRLISKVVDRERRAFAADLWSHLQPMVSWVAAQGLRDVP